MATCYEIRLNGKMIGTTFADRVEYSNDAIRLFHNGHMILSLWLPVGNSYTGEQITVKEAA